MNRAAFNGGGFNSRALASVLLATAALTASAAVVATGAHLRLAAATVTSSGLIQAAATRVVLPGAALSGQATLFGRGGQTSQCQVALTGRGTLLAYVLRDVQGASLLTGAATLTAIPASALGSASGDASATLTGDATRIQHAATDATSETVLPVGPDVLTSDAGSYLTTDAGPYQTSELCSGQMGLPHAALTADSWVTRNVQANPVGSATLYAEPGLTYCGEFPCYVLQEAYPRLLALADLTVSATGILQRMGTAEALGTATGAATAFLTQYGRLDVGGTGVTTISAEGTILIGTYSYLTGTATLAPAGARVALPTVALPTTGTLTGSPVQTHQGQGAFTAGATLAPLPTATRSAIGRGYPAAGATLTALGVRMLLPTAACAGAAILANEPDTTGRAGAADLTASATLVPTGVRELRALTDLTTSATMTAEGGRLAQVTADMAGAATLTALGVRDMRPACALLSSATMTGEGYINIVVDDPSTVVMVRLAATTDFLRPLGVTDFVRSI